MGRLNRRSRYVVVVVVSGALAALLDLAADLTAGARVAVWTFT